MERSLRDAIRKDCPVAVLAALDEDPCAAGKPLSCDQSWPLSAAVRRGCSAQLLAVLLLHGADVDAASTDGFTALDLVARMDVQSTFVPGPSWTMASVRLREERCCAQAALLLAFGAQAGRKDQDGLSAADHAEKANRFQLARLLRHWGGEEARAFRSLAGFCSHSPGSRTSGVNPGFAESTCVPSASAHMACLPAIAVDRVCEMLAPVPAWAWPALFGK